MSADYIKHERMMVLAKICSFMDRIAETQWRKCIDLFSEMCYYFGVKNKIFVGMLPVMWA